MICPKSLVPAFTMFLASDGYQCVINKIVGEAVFTKANKPGLGVFYNLRPKLKEERTLQGQLNFFGITEVNADGFAKRHKYLSFMVESILEGFHEEIDFYVDEYRKKLRG